MSAPVSKLKYFSCVPLLLPGRPLPFSHVQVSRHSPANCLLYSQHRVDFQGYPKGTVQHGRNEQTSVLGKVCPCVLECSIRSHLPFSTQQAVDLGWSQSCLLLGTPEHNLLSSWGLSGKGRPHYVYYTLDSFPLHKTI